ncbi:N-acetylglucosamine kinase [Gallaecimonas kandeliae]|uniref:N-acetylglucosamine kinase n=1 Tax=Gallaecimonas kandeliae TaxID=3029055 RepID=UPI00301051DC
MSDEKLYLGIDGGGSKCRALLYSPAGGILGEGLAGPANPVQGLERAQEAVLASASSALASAGLSQNLLGHLIVGAGLAGINAPRTHSAMLAWAHPFAAFFLTTDLHIACLGAHQGEEGAVIITGTGSSGFAQDGDEQQFLGGHGFPLGDKASGAWLGLAAVQATLLALDGLGPDTSLVERVLESTGTQDATALMDQFSGQPSAVFARLAGLVFAEAKAGDALAGGLINEGAAYLDALAQKLSPAGRLRLSMIGGLAPLWQPHLSSQTAALLSPALQEPEMGAIFFAQQRSAGGKAV